MRLTRLATVLATTALAAAPALTAPASAATGSLDSGSLDSGSLSAGSSATGTGSLGTGSQGGPGAPTTFAVIGDVPYGAATIAKFPSMIQQINAAGPAFTIHLGDIKNGSSECTDEYFHMVAADFAMFTGPLVYTPGDNEWTDCHRTNNGAYNPLERLAAVRRDFFPKPGATLGQKPMRVHVVNPRTPENVRWGVPGAAMAAVHVVGSNDGLQPWAGLNKTAPTPEQLAAQKDRMTDSIATVDQAFSIARAAKQDAVIINLQADMFDPTYVPTPNDISAFTPFVQNLVDEAKTYPGKVYLFNGDSHVYNSDKPLATGSTWLKTYGVTGAADNLTRVTVDGSGDAVKDWLKVTVTPGAAEPVSWVKVPYTS